MFLKFIGKDGSMGLKHGRNYRVSIDTGYDGKYICVKWQGENAVRSCPYSSPQSFASNWESSKIVKKQK